MEFPTPTSSTFRRRMAHLSPERWAHNGSHSSSRPATIGYADVKISRPRPNRTGTSRNPSTKRTVSTIAEKENESSARKRVGRVNHVDPQDFLEGARDYLRGYSGTSQEPVQPVPVQIIKPSLDDWNLNKYAVGQGHSSVLRDESVRFFDNLKFILSNRMKALYTSRSTVPDQLGSSEEQPAFSEKSSNLPAYSMPTWYPKDDPYAFFERESPLGVKWTTEGTYLEEINRVPLRKWESTQLGKLLEADDKSVMGVNSNGVRFTVMSYNVLSPRLLEQHLYLYADSDPQSLDFEYRTTTFFAEIKHYQPDIIGLQEIDAGFYGLYDSVFNDLGYKGVFKKRTRDKGDGCAIFYRDRDFSLVEKLDIEYYQPHVPILDRDNVGLLVKLETKGRTGRRQKLVFGTTHLLYNPKRHDVKLAQVQLMLAELDRFSFCGLDKIGQPIYCPTIMTGDFNAESYGPISKFITEGRLQYADGYGRPAIQLKRRGGDAFIPPYLGISDQCQHYKVVDARIQCQKSKKISNFEIDMPASNALTNVARSEEYSAESPALRSQDSITDLDKPSSSTSINEMGLGTRVTALLEAVSKGPPSPKSWRERDQQPDESSVTAVDMKILDSIWKQGTLCTFGRGEFSHKFHFRDVHGARLDRQGNNEGVATTKQNGWICVDYIYYNTVWNEKFGKLIEGKLKLVRRLGLLNRSECKNVGSIPQKDIPSDHFPLVAEFLLKH